MDIMSYKSAVTKAYNGVLAAILVTFFSSVFEAFLLSYFQSDNVKLWFLVVFSIITAAAWLFFMLGLSAIKRVLENSGDVGAVRKLQVACCINVIVYLMLAIVYYLTINAINSYNIDNVNLYGIVEILVKVFVVVSYILNVVGYVTLKKSITFPGIDGTNKLLFSSILLIAGTLMLLFKYINILGFIILIIAYALYILGWLNIKNSWKNIE